MNDVVGEMTIIYQEKKIFSDCDFYLMKISFFSA